MKNTSTHFPNTRFRLCLLFWMIPLGPALPVSAQEVQEASEIVLSQAERDTLIALGERQMRAGELSGAVDTFTRLVQVYPRDARLLTRLGQALLKNRDFDAAAETFKAAKKLDKTRPDAYVGLGLVYAEKPAKGMGAFYNFRRALGEAKRATKIDSTYGPAYRLLGEVYQRFREDYEKAINYYSKYVELEPDNLDGLYYFGLACVQARNYEKINRHIAPYMKKNPREVRLLPLVAQGYFFREEFELALEHFERYLQHLDEQEYGLHTDITLVASKKELEDYRSTPEDERIAYLEQFWKRRDPDILTSINERIIEHYRRVWYARTFFADKVHPWDRRGEVYIRYGEPDYRSRSIQRKFTQSPAVEALRTRKAVEMYGHEAAYLSFSGPVFPIRTHSEAYGVDQFDLLADADAGPGSNPDGTSLPDPGESPAVEDALVSGDDVTASVVQDLIGGFGGQEMETEAFGGEMPDITHFDESMGLNLQLNFDGYAPVTMRNTGALVPWETWVYTQIKGGMEITFTDETGNGQFDFAPVPPLLNAGKRTVRRAAHILQHAPEVIYRKAAADIPDYYRPGIQGEPLNFYYDLANFRGPAGQSTLEVYYGIPPAQVETVREADTSFIRVKCFLALADEGHTQIYRDAKELLYHGADSLSQSRGTFVPEILKLEVPPGKYELQVQLKDQVSGHVGLYKQAVEVRDYWQDALQISDIQLASSISEEGHLDQFKKGDIWIIPMPSRVYGKAQKVYIYYEIYNLTKNSFGQTRYKTRYAVRSSFQSGSGALQTVARGFRFLFKRRKPQVSVTHTQTGTEPTQQEYFELDLTKVKRGVNTLEVTITDEVSGQSATHEIRFRLGT